jgi:hypothetical protein
MLFATHSPQVLHAVMVQHTKSLFYASRISGKSALQIAVTVAIAGSKCAKNVKQHRNAAAARDMALPLLHLANTPEKTARVWHSAAATQIHAIDGDGTKCKISETKMLGCSFWFYYIVNLA